MNTNETDIPLYLQIMEAFFGAMFGTPLKWEPQDSPSTASWCEATIELKEGGPSITRKGVTKHFPEEGGEWEKWVSKSSPNAKLTLRSTLPNMAQKSIWYAASLGDIRDNLRSIFWGLGWNNYPPAWWQPCMKRFMKKYALFEFIPYTTCVSWVKEGRQNQLELVAKGDTLRPSKATPHKV